MIVRADLPVGFAAAQVAHAAGESVDGRVPPETNAVILAASSETALRGFAAALTANGEPHTLICEPDAPYHGAATAIGVPPRRGKLPLLSRLPLYRGPAPLRVVRPEVTIDTD